MSVLPHAPTTFAFQTIGVFFLFVLQKFPLFEKKRTSNPKKLLKIKVSLKFATIPCSQTYDSQPVLCHIISLELNLGH